MEDVTEADLSDIQRQLIHAALGAGREVNWESAQVLGVEVPRWYRPEGAMLVVAGERMSPAELDVAGWSAEQIGVVVREAIDAGRPVNAELLAAQVRTNPSLAIADYQPARELMVSTRAVSMEQALRMSLGELHERSRLLHQVSESRGTAFTVTEEDSLRILHTAERQRKTADQQGGVTAEQQLRAEEAGAGAAAVSGEKSGKEGPAIGLGPGGVEGAEDAAGMLARLTVAEIRELPNEVIQQVKRVLLGHWWPIGKQPDLSTPDGRVRALRSYLRNTFNSDSSPLPFSVLREHASGPIDEARHGSDWFARAAWERVDAYRAAVKRHPLPDSVVDTISVPTVTGGTSTRTGSRYGAILLHQKVRDGAAPQFHVTHAESGLRFCGKDGFASEDEALGLVRAFAHATDVGGLRLDWQRREELSAGEEMSLREVIKAWSGGEPHVPGYFNGELARPDNRFTVAGGGTLDTDSAALVDVATPAMVEPAQVVAVPDNDGAGVIVERSAVVDATKTPSPILPPAAAAARSTSAFDSVGAKAVRAALIAAIDGAIETAPDENPKLSEPYASEVDRLAKELKASGGTFLQVPDQVVTNVGDLLKKYGLKKAGNSSGAVIRELMKRILAAGNPPRQVTIEVPGSPRYQIIHGRDALREFRRIVEKGFPVTDGEERPSRPRTAPLSVAAVKKPKTVGDYVKALASAVSRAPGREIVHDVYYDGKGELMATDGRRLHKVSYPGELGNTPIFFSAKTLKPMPPKKEAYPNIASIIPPADRDAVRVEADTGELLEALGFLGGLGPARQEWVAVWQDRTGRLSYSARGEEDDTAATLCDTASAVLIGVYRQEYLRDTARFFRSLGREKVSWSVAEDPNVPAHFKADGAEAILIPVVREEKMQLGNHPFLEGTRDVAEAAALAGQLQDSSAKMSERDRKSISAFLAKEVLAVSDWTIARWRTLAREGGISAPEQVVLTGGDGAGSDAGKKAEDVAPSEFDQLPQKSREKFEAAWASRSAPAMAELLWPSNVVLRGEFTRRSKVVLPPTVTGTREALRTWGNPHSPMSGEEIEAQEFNGTFKRSLKECLTRAMQPSLGADAFRGVGGGVWFSSVDSGQLNFNAHVRVADAAPSAHAVATWNIVVAARKAGFEMTSYRGRGGAVWALVRGEDILTRAGAEALATGLFDFAGPETQTEAYVPAFCRAFSQWLRTLPESTLESAPAFAAKVNSTPWSERVKIQFEGTDGFPVLILDRSARSPQGVFRIQCESERGLKGLLGLVVAWSFEREPTRHWADQKRVAEKVLADLAPEWSLRAFLNRTAIEETDAVRPTPDETIVEAEVQQAPPDLPSGLPSPDARMVPAETEREADPEKLTLEERIRRYRQKRESRIARLEQGAASLTAKSEREWAGGRKMAEAIPFGQPILVGHHSERRDRAYRGRIDSRFQKAMKLGERAAELGTRAAAAAGNTAIFSDDPEANTKLAERIAELETKQATMVAVNRCVRQGDREGVAKLGFSAQQVDELFQGDSLQRVGFPDYALANNSAQIRRLKERLKAVSAAAAQETSREKIGPVEIEDCVEDNRMRIRFDRRPSKAACEYLRSRGFRWAPSESAWQRHRSSGGGNLEFLRGVLSDMPEAVLPRPPVPADPLKSPRVAV